MYIQILLIFIWFDDYFPIIVTFIHIFYYYYNPYIYLYMFYNFENAIISYLHSQLITTLSLKSQRLHKNSHMVIIIQTQLYLTIPTFHHLRILPNILHHDIQKNIHI
jgi:hypothetical protein